MNYAKQIGSIVVAETTDHKLFRGELVDYLTIEENGEESIIVRSVRDGALFELPVSDQLSLEIIR